MDEQKWGNNIINLLRLRWVFTITIIIFIIIVEKWILSPPSFVVIKGTPTHSHTHTHKLITRWKMRCNLLIPRRFTNLCWSISEKMTSHPISTCVCVFCNFCTGKRVIFMTLSCDVNDCSSRETISRSEWDDRLISSKRYLFGTPGVCQVKWKSRLFDSSLRWVVLVSSARQLPHSLISVSNQRGFTVRSGRRRWRW